MATSNLSPKLVREIKARERYILSRSKTSAKDNDKIAMLNHVALEAIIQGTDDAHSWRTLAGALNLALVLCERGYVADGLSIVKLAHEAMESIKAKRQNGGLWSMNVPEHYRTAIEVALNVHDEQYRVCSRQALVDGLMDVARRIDEEIGKRAA